LVEPTVFQCLIASSVYHCMICLAFQFQFRHRNASLARYKQRLDMQGILPKFCIWIHTPIRIWSRTLLRRASSSRSRASPSVLLFPLAQYNTNNPNLLHCSKRESSSESASLGSRSWFLDPAVRKDKIEWTNPSN
jgi:hypothetical protein